MAPRALLVLLALLQLGACAFAARRSLVEQDSVADARLQRASDCEPLEVHLALGERDGDLRVQWRTKGFG